MLKDQLFKTSRLQFDNWLLGIEKFSGLSRNRPQGTHCEQPHPQGTWPRKGGKSALRTRLLVECSDHSNNLTKKKKTVRRDSKYSSAYSQLKAAKSHETWHLKHRQDTKQFTNVYNLSQSVRNIYLIMK